MEDVMDKVQKKCVLLKTKLKTDKMDNPDMERPESLQEPLQSDDKDFSVDHLKEINDMLTYPEDFHVLKS